MATCRDVITRAYQMMGVVPFGDTPDSTEADAALPVLQSIYDRIAEDRDLMVFYEAGNVTAGEDMRIHGATLVQLPTTVVDEITGDTLPPRDLSFVQYDIGAGLLTFVSDKGTWLSLDALTLGATAPLSNRNREGLCALLAMELAETYPGAAIGPLTARKARRWQSMFSRQAALPDPEYY